MLAVAYGRGLFKRGSTYSALTGNFGVLDRRSLMGGGRLRAVVAHAGSTVSPLRWFSLATRSKSESQSNRRKL